MDNQSLMDWVFDKDNPSKNKNDPPDANMFSIPYDPKTGSFVPTLLTDQLLFHSTTTRTKDTDNTKDNITLLSTSHKTNTICTKS